MSKESSADQTGAPEKTPEKTETEQLLEYLSQGRRDQPQPKEAAAADPGDAPAKAPLEGTEEASEDDWAAKAKQYEADMLAIQEVITGHPELSAAWLKVTDPDAYSAYQQKTAPPPTPPPEQAKPEDVNAKVQGLFQKGDWLGGLALAQEALGIKNEVATLKQSLEQQSQETRRIQAQDKVRQELAEFSARHVNDGLYEKDEEGRIKVKDVELWRELNRVLKEYDIPFEDALGVAERRAGRSLKAQAEQDAAAQQVADTKKRRAISAVAGATKPASSSVDDPVGFGVFQPDGFKAAFGEGVLADKREWK